MVRKLVSNDEAKSAGFTDAYLISSGMLDFEIWVKPETDLDTKFLAYDWEEQEYLWVNGWLFTFDKLDDTSDAELEARETAEYHSVLRDWTEIDTSHD